MRIYEHEAKRVFEDSGIAIPRPVGIFRDPDEITALDLSTPVMVKGQVLIGGRGKAGGVALVEGTREAARAARRILDLSIRGYPVDSVLLETALPHTGAIYLAVTSHPMTANNIVMASASGGVDIEEVARTRPHAIRRHELPDNPGELPPAVARELGAFVAAGLREGADGTGGHDEQELAERIAEVLTRLYALYDRHDCKVVEINPLLVTAQGPVAADAKMVLDDNALFRQGELLSRLGIEGTRHDVTEPTSRERRAAFPYVDLLEERAEREPGKVYVGLVPGGAGYGIFSIDEVTNVGERFFDGRAVPVNFMDSGGGPSKRKVREMFDLLMDHPLVDLVITSRFGGISSCDIFIRGLVDSLVRRHRAGERVVPVYGRMVGTDLASARTFLEKSRRDHPEALAPLHMIVGNQKIMAEVIREALADSLEAA